MYINELQNAWNVRLGNEDIKEDVSDPELYVPAHLVSSSKKETIIIFSNNKSALVNLF